jgi:single-stranded-DNA-specific exonuclease
MQWNIQKPPREAVSALRGAGYDPIIAHLLALAGFRGKTEAEAFLHPKLAQLGDPFAIANMEPAVNRLLRAMEEGQRVLIFGDYDVDGVTSTVLLVSILRHFGNFPRYIVPRRLEEGYGLNRAALERALEEEKPDLLVAVDCGTKSIDEVAWLRGQGIDVLMIDHHRGADTLPRDCIIVNPHVSDRDSEEARVFCAVGLTFKVVHGLLKVLRERGEAHARRIRLKDYLDLVALGTVADLVPLRHENRILARHGLAMLTNCRRQGVRALFEISGIPLGHPVRPTDISFRLGPRINASGRLDDASLPIEMLLCDDFSRCSEAATRLDGMNRERQEIERAIFKEAEAQVRDHQLDQPALVAYGPDWHPGVVGIVAGKLSRQYNRPAVVLGQEGDFAQGSGRSIPGINLVEALSFCDGGEGCTLLGSWGGHPMAVGVAVNAAQLGEFEQKLRHAVVHQNACGPVEPSLEIACTLRPEHLGADLLNELEAFGPYGEGNREPVFAVRGVELSQPPEPFGESRTHLRFHLPTGPRKRISGVAWGMAGRPPPAGQPLDMAVRLYWNAFNNRRYPQIELVDWKPV